MHLVSLPLPSAVLSHIFFKLKISQLSRHKQTCKWCEMKCKMDIFFLHSGKNWAIIHWRRQLKHSCQSCSLRSRVSVGFSDIKQIIKQCNNTQMHHDTDQKNSTHYFPNTLPSLPSTAAFHQMAAFTSRAEGSLMFSTLIYLLLIRR